ncbi:MAG: hypothetical protein Kow00124_07720 [Anaerolineae bacterium]
MLSKIEDFIKYFHGQRRRTQWVIDAIPLDKALWSPWAGEPTPAEIICHLAAGHLMYATMVAHNHWYVDDYAPYTTSWEDAQNYLQTKTEEALDLLRKLPNAVLHEKRPRLGSNPPTVAWRYVMALVEDEIVHRTQLTGYLMLFNARRPSLDAVTVESVRAMLDQQKPGTNKQK